MLIANLRFHQHFLSGHRECWAQVTLLDNWWWLLWSNDVLEQQNAVCGPCWKLGSRRKRQGSVSICRADFLSMLKSHINPFKKRVPGLEKSVTPVQYCPPPSGKDVALFSLCSSFQACSTTAE